MPSFRSLLVVAALGLAVAGVSRPVAACPKCDGEGEKAAAGPARSVQHSQAPDVTLLDQDGRAARLLDVLEPGGPVAVNFIFTTCTTICPVMSATFKGLQDQAGPELKDLRLVSISIDPEHDRPAVLHAYAQRFGARASWRLYTGSSADVRAVLTAFNASPGDKNGHRPFTLVRRAGSTDWVRLDGFASVEDLAGELRPRQASR